MASKPRPFLTGLHKWIALTLGLWIALNGLSGTILVFQREIEAGLDPEFYRTGTDYTSANFEVMSDAIDKAFPGHWVIAIERDNHFADEAYRFILARNGEEISYFSDVEVFVDPVTGDILGQRPWLTFMKATRLFHMELLLGPVGKTVTGYLALVLVFTIVVGVILWWPKNGKFKRALQFRATSSTPRLIRDLHNVFGMYFLVMFLVVCITGLTAVFPRQAAIVASLFSEAPESKPFSLSDDRSNQIGLQDAANVVEQFYPGAVPTLIRPPRTSLSAYSFRIEPAKLDSTVYTSVIYVDQYAPKIVSTFDPVTQPKARSLIGLWVIYTHNGQMVGMPGRVLIFGSGLAFTILFGTGLYIWLRKRRTTYAVPTRRPADMVVPAE
jgi:uncharacterized iron-regulated membrane protein